MRRSAIAAGLLCLAVALPGVAQQPPQPAVVCGPRTALLEALERQFGEVPRAAGRLQGAPLPLIAELVVAADGSWTLITTDPSGRSCIQIGGAMWTERDAPDAAPAGRGGR